MKTKEPGNMAMAIIACSFDARAVGSKLRRSSNWENRRERENNQNKTVTFTKRRGISDLFLHTPVCTARTLPEIKVSKREIWPFWYYCLSGIHIGAQFERAAV